MEPRAGGRILDEDRWARLLQRSGAMLSEREMEVLQLIAKGITNAEAAHALSLSKATIRTHLEHIYEKLEVTNRVEAVMEGVRQGLIAL
ncbi:MAG TPA: LuxR C-terminal-related transcriptional regulator [Myxococcaceae bacterium]|nr:LuxR C-terminal-related transcriptional regulator [Myxococcaceae bacterium]